MHVHLSAAWLGHSAASTRVCAARQVHASVALQQAPILLARTRIGIAGGARLHLGQRITGATRGFLGAAAAGRASGCCCGPSRLVPPDRRVNTQPIIRRLQVPITHNRPGDGVVEGRWVPVSERTARIPATGRWQWRRTVSNEGSGSSTLEQPRSGKPAVDGCSTGAGHPREWVAATEDQTTCSRDLDCFRPRSYPLTPQTAPAARAAAAARASHASQLRQRPLPAGMTWCGCWWSSSSSSQLGRCRASAARTTSWRSPCSRQRWVRRNLQQRISRGSGKEPRARLAAWQRPQATGLQHQVRHGACLRPTCAVCANRIDRARVPAFQWGRPRPW